MKTILDQLRSTFRTAIEGLYSIDADPLLVPTQNPAFGDYQCNAAMALAKQTRQKPRDVAEAVKAAVVATGDTMVDRLEIAGPGFINVFLNKAWLEQQLSHVAADERLGVPLTAGAQTVVIDYPSPNIAKEMHIGHLRPANIGDALARVLEFSGDNLIRQNHVGDWGTAFGMLMAYMNDSTGQVDSAALADIELFYKAAKKRFDDDPAFKDASRQAVVRLQAGEARELQRWNTIIDISRRHMREMFAMLNLTVKPQDERGESFYNPLLAGVIDDLVAKGVAVPSEGATVVWVKPFDVPLMVRKTDGGFGYAATDLAALRFRTEQLFAQRIVVVTDMRQRQHFLMFTDAGRRAGYLTTQQFDHVMFGAILGADGKPIKTKSGESVKLSDVLREAVERAAAIVARKNAEREIDMPPEQLAAIARAVGVGGIKYFDLNKDRTTDYTFDWETMLATDGNTAPYLQYAHARIRSIFRKAGEAPNPSAKITLDASQELLLAKHILRLGEVIESVARELKPHLLCTYLYDLATKFSGFYEHCPVLKSEEPTRSSRLALADLAARTMALGLDLLGIEHPEQM